MTTAGPGDDFEAVLREDCKERLAPSSWSVAEARDIVAGLRQVADGEEYDAIELFGALCAHLDELHGPPGFNRLLDPPHRAAVAQLVRRIRRGTPTGSSQPDDLDRVVRLDQPVNAPYTLGEGRQVAAGLARLDPDSWQGELGRVLQALYGYLDELYGGPGAFTELLNAEDRPQVARLVTTLRRP